MGDVVGIIEQAQKTADEQSIADAERMLREGFTMDDMLTQNRVDFAIEADYSADSEMERTVQALLRQIRAVDECARLHARHLDDARTRIALRTRTPVSGEVGWIGRTDE